MEDRGPAVAGGDVTRRGGRRRRGRTPQGAHEAAPGGGGVEQRREHRGGAHPGRVPGVDTPDKRIDQSSRHLVSEVSRRDLGHGPIGHGVVLGVPWRQYQEVEGGARRAPGRDDARPGQGPQAGGHAQRQPARERAQLPTRPHVGGTAAGRHQLVSQSELPAQLHGLGTAGEEGIGPEVHVASTDRRGAELAAEALLGLEDDHADFGRGGGQRPGRAEAGDAAAHDGDGGPGSRARADGL